MEPVLARKMWRTLEPYHAFIYFTPLATDAYNDLGLPPAAHYFASRAAAMGAVPAEVVIATFFNFRPSLIEAGIPEAWSIASPTDIVAARMRAADAALRAILGDACVGGDIVEAADLARRAAQGCAVPGRPLYAGNASLAWPDEPHLVLWHATGLLREYRGDGHIAALVTAGLDGCEALVTHGTAGEVAPAILQATRGWSDAEWQAAKERLAERGLFDLDADAATTAGTELRERIEQQTDELALAPWRALGEEGADRLRAIVRPWSRAIVDGGAFGFGPR